MTVVLFVNVLLFLCNASSDEFVSQMKPRLFSYISCSVELLTTSLVKI